MKAVGPYGIPNEFYKEGGEKIRKGLEHLFKQIVEEEEVVEEWNKVLVNLIHKGGNKNRKQIKNYRPVAVTNTISNIFCRIIKEKITGWIEKRKKTE